MWYKNYRTTIFDTKCHFLLSDARGGQARVKGKRSSYVLEQSEASSECYGIQPQHTQKHNLKFLLMNRAESLHHIRLGLRQSHH